MAAALTNKVTGLARNGLRPNITFQDALGARMSHQPQRGNRNLRAQGITTKSQINTLYLNPILMLQSQIQIQIQIDTIHYQQRIHTITFPNHKRDQHTIPIPIII